jgi:hypothetical protein
MALAGCIEALFFCPPSVAINEHADMLWHLVRGEPSFQQF